MNALHLLISDPPHGDTAAAEVASRFGLTAAEVQMKANYGVPEIWFAEDDEARLAGIAEALATAGLRTVLVAGSDLVEIPGQSPADSFAFTDEGMQGERDESGWTLAYDAPITAVFSRPRVYLPDGRAPSRSSASLRRDPLVSMVRGSVAQRGPDGGQVESEASPFLDLYALSDDGLQRISIVQEITSSSLPHGLSAMQNLVSECETRFENAYIDRRLMDMTIRASANVVTGVDFEADRSGFSYATEALTHLLASLSPDLRGISQPDLSSRLAYLTNRSRIS